MVFNLAPFQGYLNELRLIGDLNDQDSANAPIRHLSSPLPYCRAYRTRWWVEPFFLTSLTNTRLFDTFGLHQLPLKGHKKEEDNVGWFTARF